MAALHYFTVPDMLWLNLQLTKQVQHYNYATLEEATFTQYAYGDSRGVVRQAAQFLAGFRRLRPFPHGNDAGAFIGCLTFLGMNGMSLDLAPAEAAAWCRKVWDDPTHGPAEIESRLRPHDGEGHGVPDTTAIAEGLMETYADACRELMAQEAPVPLA